jgi:hypothetical protein
MLSCQPSFFPRLPTKQNKTKVNLGSFPIESDIWIVRKTLKLFDWVGFSASGRHELEKGYFSICPF